MKRTLSFKLIGDPVPLSRGRIGYSATRGNYTIYDPQKQQKLVSSIELRHQMADEPLLVGPLLLEATFFMGAPKSRSTKPSPLLGKYCTKRIDLDNLLKMCMDISNKILYSDDCFVVMVNCKKVWSAKPRTEFSLTELE